LVIFMTNWDVSLWHTRAKWHSCTVHSHTTTIFVSCQKLHCPCNTSLYQPIFKSCCSPFSHNISLLIPLVKIYKEAGEMFTHSGILFLYYLMPPRFDCIEILQHLLCHSHWLPGRSNQSRNTWCRADISLLWLFQIVHTIILLSMRFNVRRAIVFTVSWII
jgi:hypothetical protein